MVYGAEKCTEYTQSITRGVEVHSKSNAGPAQWEIPIIITGESIVCT